MKNLGFLIESNKMGSVFVTLTTTKFCQQENLGIDCPVCLSKLCVQTFNFGCDKERFEHFYAEVMKKMAHKVVVDSDKFKIEVLSKEDEPLIEFQTKSKASVCSDHFFKRWNETQILFLELQISSSSSSEDYLFSLKGIWDNSSWKSLEICANKTFELI